MEAAIATLKCTEGYKMPFQSKNKSANTKNTKKSFHVPTFEYFYPRVYTPQFICLLLLVVATVLFTSLYFVTNMKYLDLDLGFIKLDQHKKYTSNTTTSLMS